MTVRTPSLFNVVLGGWLMAAPFVVGFSDNMAALLGHLIVGGLIVIIAILSVLARARGISLVNVGFGTWVVISPLILGYFALTGALIVDILTGLAVIAVAATAEYLYSLTPTVVPVEVHEEERRAA